MNSNYIVRIENVGNGVYYEQFQERSKAESFLHEECLNLGKNKEWKDYLKTNSLMTNSTVYKLIKVNYAVTGWNEVENIPQVFETLEETEEFFNDRLNLSKTKEWWKNNVEKHSKSFDDVWIEEKNGELYEHWFSKGVEQYTLLFEGVKNAPQCMVQLKAHLNLGLPIDVHQCYDDMDQKLTRYQLIRF